MHLEKPMKHVIIEIHFRYMRDFRMTMNKIKSQITCGIQESKEVLPHLKSEYGLCYLKEFDYREEIIDGKECIVISSKMNEKTKREKPRNLGDFRKTITFTTDYEKRNQISI